jgi:ABC-type taurine transport system ATPase subunit
MIHIDQLTVSYNHHIALRDLSLHISPGEFVLLTGPSGCGKSTLARCVNGLIPHSQPAHLSGRVQVDGVEVAQASVAQMARHAGLVFQNPATQLFQLSVAEEIAFGLRNLGLSPVDVAQRVDEAAAATGLEHLLNRRVRVSFSGLGFALGVALNMLPIVQRTAASTLAALRLRGGFRRNRLVAAWQLILVIITNSLRYGEEIVCAAEARAYSPGQKVYARLPVQRTTESTSA